MTRLRVQISLLVNLVHGRSRARRHKIGPHAVNELANQLMDIVYKYVAVNETAEEGQGVLRRPVPLCFSI